jgi:protein tyrosine phosphatase (PTP) superfamily phosphohydrolase (DUF442 family)
MFRSRRSWRIVALTGRVALGLILLAATAAVGYYLGWGQLGRNFHTVVPGEVYRSAQPLPMHIREWKRLYGLATILNLRGVSRKWFYAPEASAAADAGIELIDIPFTSSRQPSGLFVRRLVEALETARRPILIHCRAGADRTGMASVLAAMAVGGLEYDRARVQLSARYLHLTPERNRVVAVLELYERYCRERGLDTGGWVQFRQWAMTEYHKAFYRFGIEAPRAVEAAPGERVTIDVTLRNLSDVELPAGGPRQAFVLGAFEKDPREDDPPETLARVEVPQAIAPGQVLALELVLEAPPQPGAYELYLDLLELEQGNPHTSFSWQGSEPGRLRVVVSAEAASEARSAAAAQEATSARR